MIATSLALLALGVLLAEPVSRALAAARWPSADPVGALALWQAVGLAGGLALLGAGLTAGLSPLGDTLPAALLALATRGWPGGPDPAHLLALLATAALAARLLGVLGLAVLRTLRVRRRHRDLLDILATRWPSMSGARVLAHPLPVAYCLPGLRSRLVVSEGALERLDPAELAAVVAHERAHLRERHDLVVLPFVAWGATAPWVPGMARAQVAVAALVEMRADDVARAGVGRAALAGALRQVGDAAAVSGPASLTSFAAATQGRLRRLDGSPGHLDRWRRAGVRLLAAGLVAVPTLLLFA